MADEETKSSSTMTKVITTVFGVIIAPVTVAVAVKWGDPSVWRSAPPNSAATSAPEQQKPTDSNDGKAIPVPKDVPAKRDASAQVVNLMTPKLSESFYSYGPSADLGRWSRNDDVDPLLFTCTEKELRASGASAGALFTKKGYDNYVLILEYKWGENTYNSRKGKGGWAGIMVHSQINHSQHLQKWRQGYEILLNVGQAGSVQLRGLDGQVKAAARGRKIVIDGDFRFGFDPLSTLTSIESTLRITSCTVHALGVSERLGDLTGPHSLGEWNTVEIRCADDSLRVKINGKEVNVLSGLNQKFGKIAIDSNRAEIAFRRFELRRIEK